MLVLTDSVKAVDEFASMQLLDSPFPYEFPDIDKAETPDLFPMTACGDVTLEEATIDQLQQAMESGILTSVQLVQCYVDRFYQIDDYIK